MLDAAHDFETLARVLRQRESFAVAVSGGVDSMTLAHAAYRALPADRVTLYHSATPAVQAAGTRLVRDHAERYGWTLIVIDGGEFSDPDYLRNPTNRCYFCKSNLYGTIGNLTLEPIASGTNIDDLGDYRPGLTAARERQVFHPFVEVGFKKEDVRQLAREFGLDDVSELPAQPCLASRIETGLRVTPEDLRFIDEMERAFQQVAPGATARCRVVDGGIRVELGEHVMSNGARLSDIEEIARRLCAEANRPLLTIAPYVKGSAFLHG